MNLRKSDRYWIRGKTYHSSVFLIPSFFIFYRITKNILPHHNNNTGNKQQHTVPPIRDIETYIRCSTLLLKSCYKGTYHIILLKAGMNQPNEVAVLKY